MVFLMIDDGMCFASDFAGKVIVVSHQRVVHGSMVNDSAYARHRLDVRCKDEQYGESEWQPHGERLNDVGILAIHWNVW